ncbi:uncharacterized protein PG986_006373 [Apiospora aurea]|uniref:SMP domain-containing protein n=1 Tax=Apiospora aurea TaxID=335848 RepID=A0ABR1QK95_9PEZI
MSSNPSHTDTTSDAAPVKVPAAPASPQLEKDAARAMRGAESWKPSFARQQSFSKEEQKHALQMSGLGSGSGDSSGKSGHGFTEK